MDRKNLADSGISICWTYWCTLADARSHGIFPSPLDDRSPADLNLGFEDIYCEVDDEVVIHGWWIPYTKSGIDNLPETSQTIEAAHTIKTARTVIFFHGNAGSISSRLPWIELFHQHQCNVVLWDYRGYGQSTGKPSEKGLLQDAAALWKTLQQDYGLTPDQTLLYGRSLGGGVASWLATQDTFAGLILDSTFTSVADLAQELYPIIPIGLILRHDFDTHDRLDDIAEPILLFHSRQDETIPFSHAERNLATILSQPSGQASLIELTGGHNSGFHLNSRTISDGLKNFMGEIFP